MHLFDAASGNLGSNAIVGGGIPIATGVAWGQRFRKTDAVVVSFFGDGAINQGCFHEAANMAALYGAPVMYIVENNLYAVGTCASESSYVSDLALRSIGHGIDSLIVDGMDPVSVYLAVRHAASKLRSTPFPFLIEAKTYRFRHHGGGLPGYAFGYRSRAEEDEWQARDPASAFPSQLKASGVIDQSEDDLLRVLARDSVEEAIRFCTAEMEGKRYIPAAKWPDPASVVRDVRHGGDLFRGLSFSEREDFTQFETMTLVQAISSSILHNMRKDERIIVLGEEVGNLRGDLYDGGARLPRRRGTAGNPGGRQYRGD